jgi:hypothetical protein
MATLVEHIHAAALVENTRGMDSSDIEMCDTIAAHCQHSKDGMITKRELFEQILLAYRTWQLI